MYLGTQRVWFSRQGGQEGRRQEGRRQEQPRQPRQVEVRLYFSICGSGVAGDPWKSFFHAYIHVHVQTEALITDIHTTA